MRATISVLGLLLLAGAVSGAVIDADAATSQNLNTHGSTCKNFNAAQALDIDYLTSGVRTIAGAARPVICAVERHPVNGPSQSFFVDGSNSGGASTSCTLSSFSNAGVFRDSESFTSGAATYDQFVTLDPVDLFDYVSLLCTLPSNARGVLFGVTAIDN